MKNLWSETMGVVITFFFVAISVEQILGSWDWDWDWDGNYGLWGINDALGEACHRFIMVGRIYIHF
jgi:hypothetical protein